MKSSGGKCPELRQDPRGRAKEAEKGILEDREDRNETEQARVYTGGRETDREEKRGTDAEPRVQSSLLL